MFVLASIAGLLVQVLELYRWILIASVILSWLIAFNVINTNSHVVYRIGDVLNRLTEPLLRPIRSVLPNLGGIDLSPLVLLLLVWFVQDLLVRSVNAFAYGFG